MKVPETGIGEFSAKTFMLQKTKKLGHAGISVKEEHFLSVKEEKLR